MMIISAWEKIKEKKIANTVPCLNQQIAQKNFDCLALSYDWNKCKMLLTKTNGTKMVAFPAHFQRRLPQRLKKWRQALFYSRIWEGNAFEQFAIWLLFKNSSNSSDRSRSESVNLERGSKIQYFSLCCRIISFELLTCSISITTIELILLDKKHKKFNVSNQYLV